jgi:hypothetical protein
MGIFPRNDALMPPIAKTNESLAALADAEDPLSQHQR